MKGAVVQRLGFGILLVHIALLVAGASSHPLVLVGGFGVVLLGTFVAFFEDQERRGEERPED